MLSEQECIKILNDGDLKFSKDEMLLIRDLLQALATIEYEQFIKFSNK